MSTITAAEQAGRGGSLLPADDFDGRTQGGDTLKRCEMDSSEQREYDYENLSFTEVSGQMLNHSH